MLALAVSIVILGIQRVISLMGKMLLRDIYAEIFHLRVAMAFIMENFPISVCPTV